MGVSTLNGLRVTSARVNIPAWGCWFADVSLDGEHSVTGAATLKIADATYVGTIISGGASKGRSDYRIVAGAGGWGGELPRKAYANDAGVKLSTVITDAATSAGETLVTTSTDRVGPAFVREAGPASGVLNHLAPEAWYVDEAGTTRLGARTAGTLPTGVTHGQVDLARGKVTLASESIAAILPGIVVDGLTVVDVQHDLTPEGGLRSTVWGAQGGSSRRATAWRALAEQMDPGRNYRGLTEYRVATLEGERLNLQAVRASSGMPDLRRVPTRPGVAGCRADAALGSRVLVGFIEADPARPFVAAFEDAEGDGFQPTSLSLLAGGMAGGEHVATIEGVVVLLHNMIVGMAAMATPSLWLVSGAITGILNAAIAASNAPPAPPTAAAQLIASATQTSAMLTGPGTTSAPYAAAIAAALSGKIANDSGLFPSVGCKAVEAG
jgi:hypothetical protein